MIIARKISFLRRFLSNC